MVYDPRPLQYRQPESQAIEKLRYDLLYINKMCGFSNKLIPSVKKTLGRAPDPCAIGAWLS